MAADPLKLERDRFVAFAFASADILIELDDDGTILFVDGATLGLLGKKPSDLQNMPFRQLVHKDSIDQLDNIFQGLKRMYRVEQIELSLKKKDDSPLNIRLSGFKMNGLNDHTYFCISIPRANVASQEDVFRRDLYSGLLKKESFVEDANKKIKEAQKEGKEAQLTLLDFPTLKELLDQLPADQATQLLAEISEYLKSKSLDGDTAGVIDDGAYSFVHDGSVTEEQIVQDLLAITKKADPKGQGISPNAKSLDTDTSRLTEQDSANALLYTLNKFANESGEDFNIEALSESYSEMLEDTVEKIAHFKDTVEFTKFEIAYQPIVDIKTGVVHHYECLVRLNDSQQFDNPFHFISFGEQAGLIGEFDLAMTQKTLDILEVAAKEGNHPTVAVNISGKSLSSTMFMDAFEKILARKPSLRKQMIVEITESSKISDVGAANDFVQALREKGHLFCLDDFGTGESSFDYLRSLQVDFIKIDGSYVRESVKTLRGRQMLRAMSGLCASINVQTIGEMVEDEKAAGLLYDCGVKFGQGYLFGKPTVDEETLKKCGKRSPFYNSVVRARSFRPKDQNKEWWERDDS